MHYAENECVMPIGLHCNEIRALCLTANAICRTAEIGALHLFPAKYRQSARISVKVHRIRQYGIEHLLLGTAHEVRYSAA